MFKDIPLILYKPEWDSELAQVILELEKLRVKNLGGKVPPYIFFQLKNIFQIMESLGSARIEGNNTTLSEFVEKIIEKVPENTQDDALKEIFNIERAISFIEENISTGIEINKSMILEIHKILVEGLYREGSRNPGRFRNINVSIKNSDHTPPENVLIPQYIDELLEFINKPTSPQNDLLITALAHHRMAWIHPFDNGNGRVVRMFTYAMLIKQDFKVKNGRILNPTAIFCINREKYYDMLSKADTGTSEGVLDWCLYVLKGLKEEIEKIDKLLDITYMTNEILLPALRFSLERKHITDREFDILSSLVKKSDMSLRPVDLQSVIGQESSVQRSRIIKKLREKDMLYPVPGKARIYTIGFANNYLLRGIFHILEKNGFVPKSLNAKQ